jgi:hypothetical protein
MFSTKPKHDENPEWSNRQLYSQFYLTDIAQLSDKDILTHGLCAPMELLLKHGQGRKI